jgi:hypothetical protein
MEASSPPRLVSASPAIPIRNAVKVTAAAPTAKAFHRLTRRSLIEIELADGILDTI